MVQVGYLYYVKPIEINISISFAFGYEGHFWGKLDT
jgi:hypothetical protein